MRSGSIAWRAARVQALLILLLGVGTGITEAQHPASSLSTNHLPNTSRATCLARARSAVRAAQLQPGPYAGGDFVPALGRRAVRLDRVS